MGRLAGIDFGMARIGLALSDPMQIIASPIAVIKTQKKPEDTILLIVKELEGKDIDRFIVGLPLLLSGKDSSTTTLARQFALDLEKISKIPVTLWDERLTSKQVERMLISDQMKRKKRVKHIDTLSATLILQSYLDSPKTQIAT